MFEGVHTYRICQLKLLDRAVEHIHVHAQLNKKLRSFFLVVHSYVPGLPGDAAAAQQQDVISSYHFWYEANPRQSLR